MPTHVCMRARSLCSCGYVCEHGTAYMYIGNTFIRLHLVARNSNADVIVTVKRNMR
ncbi:hypothetical protein WN48_00226 [Eufriesea mexicana]|uniref:Uncharacterized protein n=1 Tax=Eufriesea mexicana TaxID=516756 RepID=A0A310SC36_9HYME|nr:hypothetical protein WN48_00226 [Eufriesea mexicana]